MLTFVLDFLKAWNTRVCKPHPECSKFEVTNKTSHTSVTFQKAKHCQVSMLRSIPSVWKCQREGTLERVGTILFFLFFFLFFFLKDYIRWPSGIFFFLNTFIYLFLAALGLCCCARAFSSCSVWASHCGGFSCCRSRALGAWASVIVARGLSSCGSRALERRLSSCGARA